MNKKLQIAVLKYIKGREISRSQIIDEVSKLQNCERENVSEAINILEFDGEIGAIKKYDSLTADTFTLTSKGYEVLAPWYKKKIKNISISQSILGSIAIGVLITVIGLIIEYHFFIKE